MQNPYFMLLGIYYKETTVPWDRLVRLSKDVENVGYFDEVHGLPIEVANDYLKKHEFITQKFNEPEHSITDKGKNYYGVEKNERDKKKIKEDIDNEKATVDLANARRIYKSYWLTKGAAWVGAVSGVIALILSLLKAFGVLPNK